MTKFGLELEASYLVLPEVFFSMARPDPVCDPKEIIFNQKLADEIGFDLSDLKKKERTALLSGNQIPKGINPLPKPTPVINLETLPCWGTGGPSSSASMSLRPGNATTYNSRIRPNPLLPRRRRPSRSWADAKEYVISEAMYALRIPTTRSLAVITTGEKVLRENELPGAILTRIAGSHIRVGTFEYASLHEDKTVTQALLDYLVDRHFPEIKDKENQPCFARGGYPTTSRSNHPLDEMGFIHGVMNTDNMALSGETIDYGPVLSWII